MKVRYEFTETTNLEVALHDTMLEFNGDLADCVVTIAALADIAFKPCQIPTLAQAALSDERAVNVRLSEFLQVLGRTMQMIDAHIVIRQSHTDGPVVLDLRVVDSSFALIETENQALLSAFDARLVGTRRLDRDP